MLKVFLKMLLSNLLLVFTISTFTMASLRINLHCVKSVQIRSFFWSIFGHISHSVIYSFSVENDSVFLNCFLFPKEKIFLSL